MELKVTAKKDWYIELVEDCRHCITEERDVISDAMQSQEMIRANTKANMVMIAHQFGCRVNREHNNFQRAKIYGEAVQEKLAKDLGVSVSYVKKRIQFAKEFPDLDSFEAIWGKAYEGLTGKKPGVKAITNYILPARSEFVSSDNADENIHVISEYIERKLPDETKRNIRHKQQQAAYLTPNEREAFKSAIIKFDTFLNMFEQRYKAISNEDQDLFVECRDLVNEYIYIAR